VIQVQIDEYSLKMAKVDPKQQAVEQLVRHMGRDCPECVECKEVTLHESMNHMRMVRQFAMTCKHPVRNAGDIVRCPDGFFGMYDATAKEVKEVRLEMPLTITFSPIDPAAATGAVPSPKWVAVGAGGAGGAAGGGSFHSDPDMTSGVSKISAGLSSFGPGSTTGYTRADARLNPQIPTDRDTFVPKKPINKDVPVTADGDAW
jgi:hypothetical protein